MTVSGSLPCGAFAKADETVTRRITGSDLRVFNGIPNPEGWGEDLVYDARDFRRDDRTIGAYGGLPLVHVGTAAGGLTVFNTTPYQEPFRVKLKRDRDGVSIQASGGSNIEFVEHDGDYFDAVRIFANRMKEKGISVQPAPDWAFDANWETYGFEEDFDRDTVLQMIPTLKRLGIKTITIDSGWYGEGRGQDIAFKTGDFPVNPDTVGTEAEWVDFIATLKAEGFRVRIWWVPGVTEGDTDLAEANPDWLTDDVHSATGDTGDFYLNPQIPDIIEWNKALVEKMVSYGIDGFKQDDIYNYVGQSPEEQKAYAELINGNLKIAQAIKPDFAINTCNCGLAQNFYMLPGQNQLITSDPVGSRQFRNRAKYLHALNVNGAAILSDHVELTRGDMGIDDISEDGFYDTVDFASLVPLGMVLQTKFNKDPGPLYTRWFDLFHKYQFYKMTWVNIPQVLDELETYLMQDGQIAYYTFFSEGDGEDYEGPAHFPKLPTDQAYDVFDIMTEEHLGTVIGSSATSSLDVAFKHSATLRLSPA